MLKLFLGSALLAVASACYCLSNTGVNVRDAACGNVIGNENSGCFKDKGGKATCSISDTSYDWIELDYGGRSGWIADDYLDYSDTACGGGGNCGDLRIVSREEWGAIPPTSTTPLSLPKAMTFVHHSAGGHCYTEADCAAQCRAIQNYHMDQQGWSDIGYNFLVGEDGNAYEGRGWYNQGAHATSYNSVSHGTCMIGTFTSRNPNTVALKALEDLIDCGVNQGHITSNYDLHGHRNGGCTECPGNYFYPNWIQLHSHYAGNLPGSCARKDWGPSMLYD